ncbi:MULTISPECIES: amino acid ABC transporter ATP-binding protein [Vibrio]|uniref:Glutamate ABC transporter ATP-binding protein n=3 Tax=Vibrio TaxID=662 RepID=A0A7Z1MEZ2_9VIBR|nr:MULTISPECIES: amino acid ABC transporter ATP-binding protein [Vibrio]KNH11427.1 glutamate ABC transporter ATP-binding protein [Vibrio lentus]ERM58414.1 ABC transporter related [Vibrio cyclitrophicus FF75]KAA8602830.1 ABC transporter ATP-binding protein (cluster 3 basic aa/glutamine/opines) [Vibrio cyclitrophicus]NOH17676.1 amino acid ABC transporter ATP-binding protein [Vibrio cyclitrophicus]NOH42494.1 amino acid ABC transporter ATP-binding protein [Vibrio cyclitrophicus]|tara:strand:+ start:1132 stop:1986 length:855 start_codon:yes stop_codon:yes gene_type:complete
MLKQSEIIETEAPINPSLGVSLEVIECEPLLEERETIISVENLSKQFDGIEVLRDINLTIKKGDVVSILGSSGSGKSTLLRCMNWLEQPERGTIFMGDERIGINSETGKPLKYKELAKLRERLGMVFQSFNLWPHLTVLQNVMEALVHVKKIAKSDAEEMARKQLDKVGMSHKLESYPSMLSGGQKQRVAIARALAMEPDVLLFDEPTSALDPELVEEVLLVMKKLSQEGYTMVVVTHEMEFARQVSDQVVFLEKGILIEKSNPEKFFTNPDSPRVRQFLKLDS